jgi:hypothetical protein
MSGIIWVNKRDALFRYIHWYCFNKNMIFKELAWYHIRFVSSIQTHFISFRDLFFWKFINYDKQYEKNIVVILYTDILLSNIYFKNITYDNRKYIHLIVIEPKWVEKWTVIVDVEYFVIDVILNRKSIDLFQFIIIKVIINNDSDENNKVIK